MEVGLAKQLIVRAGKDLVASGLIARTWGNVSCRIDNETFAVTPSGRAYETLTPEEIVLCRIADASYEGEIKPSSEKGIHALIYRSYPDINFVIHTHQPVASAISAAGLRSIPAGSSGLPEKVPVAGYGLPGTKKLRGNLGKALGTDSRAVIMAHHGALCFGKDYEEAFLVARQLEEACAEYIKNFYLKMSSQVAYDEQKYYNYYVSVMTGREVTEAVPPKPLNSSKRTQEGFVLTGEKEISCRFGDELPEEARIHQAIYQRRADIRFISQDRKNSLCAVALSKAALEPFLDDFAQIVGPSAECAGSDSPGAVVKALGKRMGVLIPGYGALCCASSESDLHAVQLVMEKNALAQIAARLLGKGKPLGLFDCRLMHFVYLRSYAKRAGKPAKTV